METSLGNKPERENESIIDRYKGYKERISNRNSERTFRIMLLTVSALLITMIYNTGTTNAHYITENKHSDTATLETYNIDVIDIDTNEKCDWNIQLPAITSLYSDEYFNQSVVIKRLKITNNSSSKLNIEAKVNTLDNDEEANICLYIASGTDLADSKVEISKALSTIEKQQLNSDTHTYSMIKQCLNINNTSSLEAFNSEFEAGQSKYINIAIWGELNTENNEGIYSKEIELSKHLVLNVSQITE